MLEDCCVECGHLLSRQRDLCPFCGWRLQGDDYLNRLESDFQVNGFTVADVGIDRLPASEPFHEMRV